MHFVGIYIEEIQYFRAAASVGVRCGGCDFSWGWSFRIVRQAELNNIVG